MNAIINRVATAHGRLLMALERVGVSIYNDFAATTETGAGSKTSVGWVETFFENGLRGRIRHTSEELDYSGSLHDVVRAARALTRHVTTDRCRSYGCHECKRED